MGRTCYRLMSPYRVFLGRFVGDYLDPRSLVRATVQNDSFTEGWKFLCVKGTLEKEVTLLHSSLPNTRHTHTFEPPETNGFQSFVQKCHHSEQNRVSIVQGSRVPYTTPFLQQESDKFSLPHHKTKHRSICWQSLLEP